jgi:putative spermidine/putrescine transport system substrate-binding protein
MKKVTRRNFIKGALAAAGGVAASGAIGPTIIKKSFAGDSKKLVVSSWGGTFQTALRKTYFDPFYKETGIKVIEQTYGMQGLAKVKAQLNAGKVGVDLLDGPPFWTAIGARDGLLEKIDLNRILNPTQHLSSALNEYGYAYGTISWGLAYLTKNVPGGGPKNWANFWDVKKYKGRRSFFGAIPARHIEFALMADGVPAKDVNPLNDQKVDRAFKVLEKIKSHIDIWYQNNSQVEAMLINGEIDYSEFVAGRAHGLQDRGKDFQFNYNEAVYNLMAWVMAKNAPNQENANKFLAFSSRPDRQAAFAKALYYGPSNTKAFELIKSEKVMKRLPTSPNNLSKQVELDGEFWANNLGKLKNRWMKITSS